MLDAAPHELTGVTVVGGTADALVRIPGAATAIGESPLRAQQPYSDNEVLRTVPGVHIQPEEGADLRASISIRGLDPGRSRSVLVLEDGVPVAHEIGFGGAATLRTTAYGYHTARDRTRRDYTYGPTRGTLTFADPTGSRDRNFDVAGVEPRFRTVWTVGRLTSDLDVGARVHLERARDRYVRGNTLPYAPQHRVHVAVTFEQASGLQARVDGSFVGAQFSDNFETVAGSANGRVGQIPAYHVFDATVQHAVPGLAGVHVAGSAKSLADRIYMASRRPEGIKAGLPRLTTLGLSWDFWSGAVESRG